MQKTPNDPAIEMFYSEAQNEKQINKQKQWNKVSRESINCGTKLSDKTQKHGVPKEKKRKSRQKKKKKKRKKRKTLKYIFIIKILGKLERKFLNLTMSICNNPTNSVICNSDSMDSFP